MHQSAVKNIHIIQQNLAANQVKVSCKIVQNMEQYKHYHAAKVAAVQIRFFNKLTAKTYPKMSQYTSNLQLKMTANCQHL